MDESMRMQNVFSSSFTELAMAAMNHTEAADIVKSVLMIACRDYKAHGGMCLLINQNHTLIENVCCNGISEGLEGIILNIDRNLSEKMSKAGADLFIKDLYEWEELLLAKCNDKINSTFWIPLKDISGEVIGAVVLTYLYRISYNKMKNTAGPKDFIYLASILIDNFRQSRMKYKEIQDEVPVDEFMLQNEEKTKQTYKMEALGTLAGGIAHDFNNILTGIVGYTELSLEDAPKDSVMYQCLMECLKLAARAKELVSQILSFGRKTVNISQRIDVEKVLRETMRMLRATIPSTISFKEYYRCTSAFLYADPIEIQQLIMNLCINAEHAMREKGGTLTVSSDNIDNTSGKNTRFNGIRPGRFVKISIKDTGCGMDKQTMERIFEPFFTTKGAYEGTGLGLAVVHGIVTHHKGFITVNSEPGKGSVFDVFLPL